MASASPPAIKPTAVELASASVFKYASVRFTKSLEADTSVPGWTELSRVGVAFTRLSAPDPVSKPPSPDVVVALSVLPRFWVICVPAAV